MAKTKEQKKQTLQELKDNIDRQKTIMFVDFTGLKVKDMFVLRKRLKKAVSELKVAKKTLIKLVFEKTGLKLEAEKLKGEIALIFGYEDGISTSKVVYQFSQENPNLKILGGFFENKFKEKEDFVELAKIPSQEELLARLAGSLAAPMSNLVRALQYNLKGLVHVLSTINK